MHVNLLPFHFQRKLLLRRLIRQWTATWTVCAIAIALFVGFRYSRVHRERIELQQAELGCADIRTIVASNLQLETSLASLVAIRAQLSQLEPDQDALAALATIAHAVGATQGRAQMDTLQFHEPRTFTAAPAGPATTATPNQSPTVVGVITLNGLAADDEAIASLIETMQKLPQMRKVELRASSTTGADGARRRFEIDCRY